MDTNPFEWSVSEMRTEIGFELDPDDGEEETESGKREKNHVGNGSGVRVNEPKWYPCGEHQIGKSETKANARGDERLSMFRSATEGDEEGKADLRKVENGPVDEQQPFPWREVGPVFLGYFRQGRTGDEGADGQSAEGEEDGKRGEDLNSDEMLQTTVKDWWSTVCLGHDEIVLIEVWQLR